MATFGQHDINHPDPLMRPQQSLGNKLRRALWALTWALFCRWTPNPMHRWRCFVLRCFGAKLGNNNFIYPSAKIWDPRLLETEDVVAIAQNAYIYNVGGVRIGHHAIVSDGVLICGATHDYQDSQFPLVSKKIEIGAYAWICARAIVLPGVSCGEGCVLGAGAVTSKDLKAWTVYAGNRAVEVGERNTVDDF